MSQFWRRIGVIALFAFLAAMAGVLVGRTLVEQQSDQHSGLHDLLHEQLDLDSQQRDRVEQLEAQFAVRRRALELELRAENARLAAAIQSERGYGPRVTAEVDRSHRIMGDLQKETLVHIFAMRSVLRPDQAERFDRAVGEALTAHVE